MLGFSLAAVSVASVEHLLIAACTALHQDEINLGSIVKLWAERRAGKLLAAMDVRSGRPKESSPTPRISD